MPLVMNRGVELCDWWWWSVVKLVCTVDMQIKSKFWGKSLEVQPVGLVHLKLPASVLITCLCNRGAWAVWTRQITYAHLLLPVGKPCYLLFSDLFSSITTVTWPAMVMNIFISPIYFSTNTVHNTVVKKWNYNINTKENKNNRYSDN